jgi:hypothetical protein
MTTLIDTQANVLSSKDKKQGKEASRVPVYFFSFLAFIVVMIVISGIYVSNEINKFFAHPSVIKVGNKSITETFAAAPDVMPFFVSWGWFAAFVFILWVAIHNVGYKVFPKLHDLWFVTSGMSIGLTVILLALGSINSIPGNAETAKLSRVTADEVLTANIGEYTKVNINRPNYGYMDKSGQVYQFAKTIDGRTATWNLEKFNR